MAEVPLVHYNTERLKEVLQGRDAFASRTPFRGNLSQFWEQDRKGLLTWFSVECEGNIHPIVP